MSQWTLDAPARLHFSLLDMSADGYRRHGGLGLAIGPGYLLHAKKKASGSCAIVDYRNPTQSNSDQSGRLSRLLEEACRRNDLGSIEVVIEKGYDAHSGLGSGTSLSLASLELLHLANEREIDRITLIKASGRGGVSGVGISCYFDGGFVIDAGVKGGESKAFVSSDDVCKVEALPLPLFRLDMPDWPLALWLPRSGGVSSRADERNFFADFSGAGAEEVANVAYIAFLGLLPAVIEADLQRFQLALRDLQGTYWKAAERAVSTWLSGIDDVLDDHGLPGLSLSSFGPSAFTIGIDAGILRRSVGSVIDADIRGAICRNYGRMISHA